MVSCDLLTGLSVRPPACLSVCSMEGGELFHRVKSRKQLSEPVTKLYFYQMLRAVQVRLMRGCYGNRKPCPCLSVCARAVSPQ